MLNNNKSRSKQATVRPFIQHPSGNVPPVPPPPLNDIISSQSFYDDDDEEAEISASQLFRQSNFKIPTAPKGILKRSSQHPASAISDSANDSFFGSQSWLFDDTDSSQNDLPSSAGTSFLDDENHATNRLFGSQMSMASQPSVMASQQSLSQDEDTIPSSQPTQRHGGQRFIPSFTSKRVRIADDTSTSWRQNNFRLSRHSIQREEEQATVADSPFCSLDIPEFTTPGGTTHGSNMLRSVNEIPKQYRCVFPFPYFNIVQSKVLDDVLHTNNHMVICAPTGSGKTAVFELAIVHMLMAMGDDAVRAKIVYMAPIKALCSQRCLDWKEKFEPLGLKCQELTGDTEVDDYFQLQEVNIVMTTPEKWDSMTRKWRDNKSLVQLVRLFLIDEVHSLNEEQRGATVEAVISRMKTVQAAVVREASSSKKGKEGRTPPLRFLAVSATIPNIEDVAAWLETGGKHAVYHKLDESHRPVKLRKVVLSYPCSKRQSEFCFDLSLNYKLSSVIHTYSDQKPTLVFCATRKSVQQAASILVKEARFIMSPQHRQRLQKMTGMIREAKLRELLLNGVGFHHAGLDAQDRKYIEELFISGDLPVLIATSTLAMGVNLPAHLVVVKSTQHYVSGMYCEYTETQVLQMIGRAGRPQFDTSATAVIMTKHESKSKYESLMNGCDDIESSLHNHLIEHLNAEIVLHTINDISIALEWLKSTFLYIRIMKNPSHYGIPIGLSKEQMETKLQDMCIKDLNLLSNFGLVKMDPETMDLKPLEIGRLMARYCIAFDTMKEFSKLTGTESVEDLVAMLCQCKEFADIQLRVNERKVLNTLNKDKNRVTIRYPMKGKIKTTDMKVNCLVQSTLGCLPIQDFGLTQDCTRIFRAGQRLTRCLLEYLMQRNDFQALLHAAMISKCFKARLWENSKYIARQIDKIGPALGTALVNAGMVNFQKLESTNPREIELILNRHPPFGNQILDAVTHLPKYDVSIEQVPRYSTQSAEVTITISLMNQETLREKQTAKFNHGCLLLIGDADNRIVYKQRITDMQLLRGGLWCKKIDVKRATQGEELGINLISQDYVGLDVQSTYTPFYSGPKHLRAVTSEDPSRQSTPSQQLQHQLKTNKQAVKRKRPTPMNSYTPQENENNSVTDDEGLSEFSDRKPCGHRCSNKDSCGHECCKFGVPIRHPPAAPGLNKRSQASSTASSQPASTSRTQRLSGLGQYFRELHAKADGLSVTPNTKRIKVTQGGSNKSSLDLDRFAFSRMSKPSIPPNTPSLSASSSAAAQTPNLTPKLTPQPTPWTPATPSSAKGWEMLDMYHQTRCQDMMSEDEQGGMEDTLTGCTENKVPTTQDTESYWNDECWTNIDADVSWSDSDQEEMVVDRYVQPSDDGNNGDHEDLPSSQQDDELLTNIPNLGQLNRPQHHQYTHEKDLTDTSESAPGTSYQNPQPYHQQWTTSSRGNTGIEMRRRGQVFAWRSPKIRQQSNEAPVSDVIHSPPIGLNPAWSCNRQLARQPMSHTSNNRTGDFVSAKSAMASQQTFTPAPGARTRDYASSSSSMQDKQLERSHELNDSLVSEHHTQEGPGHEVPEPSDADTSVIVLSDDDPVDSSNPYVMNSSSDEEFLNSCLEVESLEAKKGEEAAAATMKRDGLAVSASPRPLEHTRDRSENSSSKEMTPSGESSSVPGMSSYVSDNGSLLASRESIRFPAFGRPISLPRVSNLNSYQSVPQGQGYLHGTLPSPKIVTSCGESKKTLCSSTTCTMAPSTKKTLDRKTQSPKVATSCVSDPKGCSDDKSCQSASISPEPPNSPEVVLIGTTKRADSSPQILSPASETQNGDAALATHPRESYKRPAVIERCCSPSNSSRSNRAASTRLFNQPITTSHQASLLASPELSTQHNPRPSLGDSIHTPRDKSNVASDKFLIQMPSRSMSSATSLPTSNQHQSQHANQRLPFSSRFRLNTLDKSLIQQASSENSSSSACQSQESQVKPRPSATWSLCTPPSTSVGINSSSSKPLNKYSVNLETSSAIFPTHQEVTQLTKASSSEPSFHSPLGAPLAPGRSLSQKPSSPASTPVYYQGLSKLTQQPSPSVCLSSPPSSCKTVGAQWGRKVCSPLLRRQKARDFFTATPDKSPEAGDEAQAALNKIFRGIFS